MLATLTPSRGSGGPAELPSGSIPQAPLAVGADSLTDLLQNVQTAGPKGQRVILPARGSPYLRRDGGLQAGFPAPFAGPFLVKIQAGRLDSDIQF
jgi:hypothetical protein